MKAEDRKVAAAYPGFRAAAESWRGFAAIGFFSFFVNLGALASPLYMQQIFDRVMQSHHVETLIYLTVIFIAFLGVIALLDAVRGLLLARLGRWWDETVHADLLKAVVETSHATGQSRNYAIGDLMTVRQFVGGPNVLPFFDAPWTPLFILAIALIHPWLAVVAACAGALLLVVALINSYVTRARMTGLGQHQAQAQATADMATRHADSVVAMNLLPGVLKRFADSNDRVAGQMHGVASITAYLGSFSRFVRFAAQIGVLGLGAYLAPLGEMTAGGMIAASVIMGRALAPADQALSAWRAYVSAREAQTRIAELFRTAPTGAMRIAQPALKGFVSVKDLTYARPGATTPILSDISLELRPGTINAFVGPSGSGKSTLCKLLIGSLTPSAGEVRIDGAEIGNWDRAQLGAGVGYLSQSVELLDATVAENIARLGEPDEAKVVAAARLTGGHDLANSLPEGYETVIGDGGVMLSGGQAQRIGFARAVYGSPKLVVLDEPNANLDAEGEVAFRAALQQLKSDGATIMLVTHKPATLIEADQIIALQGGRVKKIQSGAAFKKQLAKPMNALVKKAGDAAAIAPLEKVARIQAPASTEADTPRRKAPAAKPLKTVAAKNPRLKKKSPIGRKTRETV